MPSLFDTARIQDGRPGPVYIGSGKTYHGPVWKDASGYFVIYNNDRIAVGFDPALGEWQRLELICPNCGRSRSIGCGCGDMPHGC
jgi:hypothetical protein